MYFLCRIYKCLTLSSKQNTNIFFCNSFLCKVSTLCSLWGRKLILIYRVSQEESAGLREGVPYVKVYRYNPKNYVQSWTVTEIKAREKCGLLAGPRTVLVSWQPYPCPSLSVVSYYGNSALASSKLLMYFLLGDKAEHVSAWHSCRVYYLEP